LAQHVNQARIEINTLILLHSSENFKSASNLTSSRLRYWVSYCRLRSRFPI